MLITIWKAAQQQDIQVQAHCEQNKHAHQCGRTDVLTDTKWFQAAITRMTARNARCDDTLWLSRHDRPTGRQHPCHDAGRTPRINRRCTRNETLRRVRVTTVAVEEQYVLHILSVSVALVTQHAKRMRRIILSSVACPALPYFSVL
jgi:hypothetical protein